MTPLILPSTKVVDLVSEEEMGSGDVGELCFQGPQVMPGYFKNATATAETLIDGWCHTGDIGYYDKVSIITVTAISNLIIKDGRVFIVDRKKELIKVKGLQVAPAELENLIRTIEGVTDVAVIGRR